MSLNRQWHRCLVFKRRRLVRAPGAGLRIGSRGLSSHKRVSPDPLGCPREYEKGARAEGRPGRGSETLSRAEELVKGKQGERKTALVYRTQLFSKTEYSKGLPVTVLFKPQVEIIR